MALRLADFIVRYMELITEQWESFARTLLPAASIMGSFSLRDHAVEILEAIVKDLRTSPTREERVQKSKGLAPKPVNTSATAAQMHALLRARSGFDVVQLAAEYRALRASVLRLWLDDCMTDIPPYEDIIRFDEAIDQALAESISFFSAQMEQSRNLFLGMLAKELRSPLESIQLTATHLSTINGGDSVSEAAERLIHSGRRMHALLDDMMDFNRTQLGLGIRVTVARVDLAKECADELNEVRKRHPRQQIDFRVEGDAQGSWDERRLRQLLGNLVINAIQYGKSGSPLWVTITGEPHEVRIEVSNMGDPMYPPKLDLFFEPRWRGIQAPAGDTHLGLGLYIAREITKAHHGTIHARSKGPMTTVEVHLPRM